MRGTRRRLHRCCPATQPLRYPRFRGSAWGGVEMLAVFEGGFECLISFRTRDHFLAGAPWDMMRVKTERAVPENDCASGG